MTLPPLAHLTNGMSSYTNCSMNDWLRIKAVKEGKPGWSQPAHYLFFRELLRDRSDAKVLMCGVYHGLDLAYLSAAAEDLGQSVALVGVDLFEDAPCKDWETHDKKADTWLEAVGVPAPNMEAAKKNCPQAVLHRSDSVSFMRQSKELFDIIYLDTSHDAETVDQEITAALPLLLPNGILCGDDYGEPKWGVGETVQRRLRGHVVFFSRIWAWAP